MEAKAGSENEAETEAERRETQKLHANMSFKETLKYFCDHGHLPAPEDYDVKDFYENFDEYKKEQQRINDTWTGADITTFAEFEEALRESYEIEKEIEED